MMDGSALGCDDFYDCYFVVVNSGGVVVAMDGFPHALRGVSSARRSHNTAGKRAPAKSPSSDGR